MKYVSVRHKPEHTNVWWFSVPTELSNKVTVGAEVLCNTKKGCSPGRIVSVLDNVGQADAEKIVGNHFPLKSIFAVSVDLEMSRIHIPLDFMAASPSSYKIEKRVDEFYRCGKFDTPVIFTSDGTLRDGYTAYLVAKMFDHDTLRGFCISEGAIRTNDVC